MYQAKSEFQPTLGGMAINTLASNTPLVLLCYVSQSNTWFLYVNTIVAQLLLGGEMGVTYLNTPLWK